MFYVFVISFQDFKLTFNNFYDKCSNALQIIFFLFLIQNSNALKILYLLWLYQKTSYLEIIVYTVYISHDYIHKSNKHYRIVMYFKHFYCVYWKLYNIKHNLFYIPRVIKKSLFQIITPIKNLKTNYIWNIVIQNSSCWNF